MPQFEIPEGIRFVSSEQGIQEFLLETNGLRILLMEDHSAPVAAVMVSYLAGSRDESEGKTGAAHILEHMMFKGTEKYHKHKGTQIAHLIEQTGAMINANTGYDSTNYFELLPSDKLELALDIEADRMRGTILEPGELAHEKNVVLNELERYFDSPVTDLVTSVWNKAFDVHPYKHPIIGFRKDVEAMTPEALKEFYDTYYWPDHAVLTITGDFSSSEALKLIKEKFSPISRSAAAAEKQAALEPEQTEPREVVIERPEGAEFLMVTHKMPGALDPDAVHLDLLALILSHGKTSRLYQRLVEKGLGAQVESGSAGTRDPGLFTTMVTLTPETKHEDVLREVLQAYDEIKENGLREEELTRAKNLLRANAAYSRDGALSVASELANAISAGDWKHYAGYLDKALNVTIEEVQRAARHYLIREKMTVGKLSARLKTPGAAVPQPGTLDAHDRSEKPESSAESNPLPPAVPESPAGKESETKIAHAPGSTYYKDTVRVFENGGTKFFGMRTEVKGMVSISGSMRGGGTAFASKPQLARLTAMMMDQGTERKTKYEIASLLENRGAQIQFSTDTEHLRFSVRCLSEDVPMVFEILSEMLRAPAFDESELRKLKQQEQVRLQYMMDSTSSQAVNEFLRAVFPHGHALYPPTLQEELAGLENISAEDIRAFYKDFYGSQELLIAAAGDHHPETTWDVVKKEFGGWEPKSLEDPFVKEVSRDSQTERRYVKLAGKGNMDILLGHPMPLKRLDPDFLPAYLANYVLGGDFTSRLSNTVRDRYGLTYGIRSGFAGITEDIEGAWLIHMIVTPRQMEEGIRRVYEQIEILRKEGIAESELERKKLTVIGRFKIGLATSRDLAEELIEAAQWKLGPHYLDRFPDLVQAAKLSAVREAVGRYFAPRGLTVVASGDLPAESAFFQGGAPLQKENP